MGKKARRLLEAGYFPTQLPPQFTTKSFAKRSAGLLRLWAKAGPQPKTIKPEAFSVARTGHRRRILSISNPVTEAPLAYAIERNWTAIRRHLTKSRLSVSKAAIDFVGATAFAPVSLHVLYGKKITASGGFQYLLKADISRFYPTIYTHAIAWAVHGKAKAKANKTSRSPTFFGNLLDKLVRDGQDQQTIGLPIGADTSRIIAELVAVAVDLQLRSRLRRWPAGFRYVDDYYLFFESKSEAENALAHLSTALREFELQLNFEKTQVIPIHRISDDSWTHQLRDARLSTEILKQRSDINRYFDHALELAESRAVESVMRYALRRIASTVVRKENWEYFEAHLCRVAFAHPNTLQDVAEFLSTYRRYGYPISKERIARVCNKIIGYGAPLGHHSEVAWCLWICLELSVRVERVAIVALESLTSSVCLLLALELGRKGLLSRPIKKGVIAPFMAKDALYGESWLLSYEAGRIGYPGCSATHIKADPRFEVLLRKKVAFFDLSKRLPPLFSVSADAKARLDLESENELFDKDVDFSEFLEFDDSTFEYHDISELLDHENDSTGVLADF